MLKRAMLKKALSHKYAIPIALLIALVFVLPSLNMGLYLDDYIQKSFLHGNSDLKEKGMLFSDEGASLKDALLHNFTFFDSGIEGQVSTQAEYGSIPWWVDPEIQISFFRPITSFTHWLDYKLWPDSPTMMHLHSVIWFSLFLVALVLLYKRLIGTPWIAVLAFLFYIFDSSYMIPVSWLCNRNVIIAAFFGVLAILFHDKWRNDNRSIGGYVSGLLILLSLFSAEAGVASCAIIFSYALFLDKGNIKERIISLLPMIAAFVIWRVIYVSLGYGAQNTAMYADPASDPVKFIIAFGERAPLLLFSQFTGVDFDDYGKYSPMLSSFWWLVSLGGIVVLSLLFFPLLKKNKKTRFFATSTMLAVVPVTAFGLPQGRLLFFVSIPAMALLALYIDYILYKTNPLKYVLLPITAVGHFLIPLSGKLLLIIAILLALLSGQRFNFPSELYTNFGNEKELSAQTLVVINAPSPFDYVYTPHVREYFGLPNPESIRVLAPALSSLKVTRNSKNSLIVEPIGGFLQPPKSGIKDINYKDSHPAFLFKHLSQGYRIPERPFKNGEVIKFNNMSAKILSLTDDNRPEKVEFIFENDLEDKNYKIIFWRWNNALPKKGDYSTFNIPGIGEEKLIKGPF